MKSVVTSIITSIFDRYINPIEECQLSVELWNGNALLNNVTIKSSALSSHELPFTVKDGTIKSIKFHFPWTSINSVPCEIDIEGININAELNKNVDLRSEIEIKESILKDLDEACKGDKESKQGLLSVTISKIVDNMIFRVKDVNVTIDLTVSNSTSTYKFTAGIQLNSIECFTVNDVGEKAFVSDSNKKLRKQLIVNGFSIYLDTEKIMIPIQISSSSSSSNIANSQENLNVDFKTAPKEEVNHQMILDSFSFTSFITRTRNERSTQTEVQTVIEKALFKVVQSQLVAISEFQFQFNMFALRCKYFICGHPNHLPRSERSSGKWWRFIHRCTLEKRFPNRLKLDEVVQMLKTRNTYLDLWKKKKSMPEEKFKETEFYQVLKRVESSLNLNTILFLRCYAEYRMRINNDDNNADAANADLIKFDSSELSKLLAENNTVQSFSVSLAINDIQLIFFKSQSAKRAELTLGAWNLDGSFVRSFDRNSSFEVTCDVFKVFTPESVIFQQGEKSGVSNSNKNKESDFSFSYKIFPGKSEKELEVCSKSPKISINPPALQVLKVLLVENGLKANPSSSQFASLSFIDSTLESAIINPNDEPTIKLPDGANSPLKKSQSVNLALQKICEEYPYLKIKIKCSDLQVGIENTKLGLNMKEIQINSFPIHERHSYNPETLYENYQLDFSDLTIRMDDEIILQPVSTYIKFSNIIAPIENLDKFKLGINVSEIALAFSHKSYAYLIETVQNLVNTNQDQDEIQEIPQAQLPQNPATVDSNEPLKKAVSKKISKVTICIQKVSLNLITIGEFQIINFGALAEISTGRIKSKFKFQDIRCNSTKKKIISFNLPKNNIIRKDDVNNIDFSEGNSAVIGNFLLNSHQPFQAGVTLNSPTIMVDIEGIKNSLSFFKVKSDKNNSIPLSSTIVDTPSELSKSSQTSELSKSSQTSELAKSSQTTDEKEQSIIDVKLNNPRLMIRVPTVDKEKDRIEFSFVMDQISFNKGEVSLSNISLFNNGRKIVGNTDINYSIVKSILSSQRANIFFENQDYPLLLEMINYILFYCNKYLNSEGGGQASEKLIQFSNAQLVLKDKFDVKIDQINGSIEEFIKFDFSGIKANDLILAQPFLNTSNVRFIKKGDKMTIEIASSTSINLNLDITHFLYEYFTNSNPKRVDYQEESLPRTVPIVVDVILVDPNLYLPSLSFLKAKNLTLTFSYLPDNTKISIDGEQILFDKTNLPNNSILFADNTKNDYFLMSDKLAFSFGQSKINVGLTNAHINFDYEELMDYVNFTSIIANGYPTGESNPTNIPPIKYDVKVDTFNVNMNQSTTKLVFNNLSLQNDPNDVMTLLVTAEKMDALSSQLNNHFSHSENIQFTLNFVTKNVYPQIVDKNKKNQNTIKQISANKPKSNKSSNFIEDLFGLPTTPKQNKSSDNYINLNNKNLSSSTNENLIDLTDSDSFIARGSLTQNSNQNKQSQYRQSPIQNPIQATQPQYQQNLIDLNQFYTPQQNQPNQLCTPKQNQTNQFYTPKQNQTNQFYTPKQNQPNQLCTPQQNQSNQFYTPQQNQPNSNQQINTQSSNKVEQNPTNEKKNYLHGMNFILKFGILYLEHKDDCVSDFVNALNFFFKRLFSKKINKFIKENTAMQNQIEYEFNSKFSIIANSINILFSGYPSISVFSLNFTNENSAQSVEVGKVQINSDQELINCLLTPFFSMSMKANLIEMQMNEAIVKIDANSSLVSDLIFKLIRSPLVTKLSLSSDEPKPEEQANPQSKLTFYQITLQKLQLVLFSEDLYFYVTLAGNLISSHNLFQFQFNDFTLSFVEKENRYEPIVKDLSIHFEKVEDEITILLNNCNFYVSPSDIIDIKYFYNKTMKLVELFMDKSRTLVNEVSKDQQLKKGINKVFVKHSAISFLFCEDNRSTKIPFPFLLIKASKNYLTIDISSKVSFSIPKISFQIFNKKTQKWDYFIEPLSLSFELQNKKNIRLSITSGFKIVLSMQSIVQFMQFSFKRQKYSDNRKNPNYVIENNTDYNLKFLFSDNAEMGIPANEKMDFFDSRPFQIGNVTIDPEKFVSPQLINNYYSLSIFEKNRIRYLSINSTFIIKNKSDISLVFQDTRNNIASILPKRITPLSFFSEKFAIFGNKNPQVPELIDFNDIRNRKKALIPVYAYGQTYYFILGCRFSKKRGVIMLTLYPQYTVFNHLKIPISLGIPSTMTNIIINAKSKAYLNHVGFKDSLQFYIATNENCTKLTSIDLTKQSTIPALFNTPQKNNALLVKYNNFVLSIKPPLIFTNRTNFNIKLYDYNGNEIGIVKGNKEMFVGTLDYFQNQSISLSFEIENYKRTRKFEVKDERREIYLRSIEFPELYLPLVTNLTIGTSGILHFNVNNLVFVKNEAKSLILLSPLNDKGDLYGSSITVDANEEKPISISSKIMNFMLAMENTRSSTKISLLNNDRAGLVHSTILFSINESKSTEQKIEVEFQSSNDNSCYYVIFREMKFPQPLMVTNLLDEGNKENQPSHPIILPHGIVVEPMSTTIFYSISLSNEVLQFECYNQAFMVDLYAIDSPNKVTVNGNGNSSKQFSIFYIIKTLENGCHLLVISRKLNSKKETSLSSTNFNISFDIPTFFISIVDDKSKELSIIGFSKFVSVFNRSSNSDFISLSIESFQIDDLFPDTAVPVVAFDTEVPFVEMTLTKPSNSSSSFKQVYLNVRGLTLYLDLNFISEVIHYVKTISILQHRLQNENELKYNPYGASNKSSITIENMIIKQLKVNFSISSQTGRPLLHSFESDILPSFIPPINDLNLVLPSFCKTNINASASQVFSLLLENYKESLKEAMCNFLPSPEGLARSLSSAFHQINISPARKANSPANQSISPINQKVYYNKPMKTTGTPVNFNQSSNKVIGDGFKALGKGIVDGISGIVRQPMQGYQEGGTSGLFNGLAKGFVGLIASPTAGIIDATNGMVDSVRNSGKKIIQPLRFPRYFPNDGQIVPYSKNSSICQIVYQRHIQNYFDYFVFFIDDNPNFVGVSQTNLAFFKLVKLPKSPPQKLSTEQRGFLNDEARMFKFDHMRRLVDVNEMTIKNNQLFVTYKKIKGNDVINCPNKATAVRAKNIIFSRKSFSNIISVK